MENLVAKIEKRIESNNRARKMNYDKMENTTDDKVFEECRIAVIKLSGQIIALEQVLGDILFDDEQDS